MNPRGAEHHDGVAYTFRLQLGQWIDVLGKYAQRTCRRAFQKLGIFVRRLRRVLRLGPNWLRGHFPASRPAHCNSTGTPIVGTSAPLGNAIAPICVELSA